MDNRIVHIFWTGGLDSTYRVVELSRQACVIQPHYIIIDGRKTVKNELKAISDITAILNSDKRSKAKILPLLNVRRVSWKSMQISCLLGNCYIK